MLFTDIHSFTLFCYLSSEADASGSEESYLFLKRICQVLVQLGVCQLAPLWDSEKFVAPESFYGYLTVMQTRFTQHPSQVCCVVLVHTQGGGALSPRDIIL